MLLQIPRAVNTLSNTTRLAAAALVCASLAGCAAASASRVARQAEDRQDYDLAIVQYTRAVRLHPNDVNARSGLERSKLRSSQDHFVRARRLSATGKLEQALVEYEVAAELNPTNPDIDQELRSTRNELRTKVAVDREGKSQLESVIERAREMPPPGLDLPADGRMPASVVFRDASSRDVFVTIGRFANITLGFDSAFRDAPVTIDLRNATLADALNAVTSQTHTFYRVITPRSVTIIPDTPAKRREYEEEVVQTFPLSNADLKETMDLLRVVLDARRVSPIAATNSLTIKDTPENVAAAGRVIAAIDKARPEVIVDVELLEVNRSKLQEYGLQFASSGSAGINGTASVATDASGSTSLETLRNLTQSDILLANLPTLYYRLLKSDTNTRTLANPQIRMLDGTSAIARFGDQVPVPQTTFLPIATGGTPQQPLTTYNYVPIGVNIDITPRMHYNDDVSLSLKVAVTSISGTGFGGAPTIGNREITTQISLRDGETNMLAGLIRDDERRVIQGIPGLSDLPVLGPMFRHASTQRDQTDIILTLTPHIIRVLDVSEDDLRAFRVGRDALNPIVDAFDSPAVPLAPAAPAQGPAVTAPQTPRLTEPTPNAPAQPSAPPASTIPPSPGPIPGH
jgi:general secretion pathway protein D